MTVWRRTLILIGLLIGVTASAASAPVIRGDDDPAAQTQRGLALLTGDGVRQDVTAGLNLLRTAAQKAHPPALRALGDVFAAGTLVRKDEVFAVALYRAAAQRGDAEAKLQLARRSFALLLRTRLLF